MKQLELKIPPPIVMLTCLVLMWLIQPQWGAFYLDNVVKNSLAFLFIFAGLFLDIHSLLRFRKASTTISPLSPEKSSQLVSSGIYRITRNPMYLGMLLILLGWFIFVANYVAFVFLPIFVYYISRFQIKPEEIILAQLFGEEYSAYCQKVRRWL